MFKFDIFYPKTVQLRAERMVRQSSRMQKLEEKRNLKKAIWFTLGTLAIVGALATLGFNLLAKFFVFLGDIRSPKGVSQEKTDFIPPGPPQIVVPFEATNSAGFSIRGIAEPGTTVYLSRNEAEVTSLTVPEEGIFEFEKVALEEGKNVFTSVAVDEAGNKSQTSSKSIVNFDTSAPPLQIMSPTDRQKFSGKDAKIEIKGKTDTECHVTINERVAIVGNDGSFNLQLGLNPGENPLVIISTDSAGNMARKELSVEYN